MQSKDGVIVIRAAKIYGHIALWKNLGQQEESMARRIEPADDLQLMCTKKCIPCHRCGSSMKFFMRRVKYLNTVKVLRTIIISIYAFEAAKDKYFPNKSKR